MSTVRPSHYYKCDYCTSVSPRANFKYSDNSGLNNQDYDMCSDECLEKHIAFLRNLRKNEPRKFGNGTVDEHIKEFIYTYKS